MVRRMGAGSTVRFSSAGQHGCGAGALATVGPVPSSPLLFPESCFCLTAAELNHKQAVSESSRLFAEAHSRPQAGAAGSLCNTLPETEEGRAGLLRLQGQFRHKWQGVLLGIAWVCLPVYADPAGVRKAKTLTLPGKGGGLSSKECGRPALESGLPTLLVPKAVAPSFHPHNYPAR